MPFDDLFDNLRRGPWSNDPNPIPQEAATGGGNVEPTGWLADGSVSADVIQANAVTAAKITAGAITADKIAAGAITSSKIDAGSITADKIASNAVTADKIAANAVTAGKIAANSISASHIVAGTITASELAANSVTASKIAANAVTADAIAANSVTANDIVANAITTSKIAAGNVTSSRIELTISGKNFGANSGTQSAPGIFFDAASTMGIGRGSTQMFYSATSHLMLGNVITLGNSVPFLDNSFDLGSSGLRWDVVYRTAESSASDRNLKTAIADAPLGLDFIRILRPRVYRWRDAADTQKRHAATVAFDAEALAAQVAPHEERIADIRARQQAGEISDERAEAAVQRRRDAIAAIQDRHIRPLREAQSKRRSGRRLHYGLIAQEVKEALDAVGVDPMDAAFWQKAPSGEESLSYTELIAPLIKAVQELAARTEALEQRAALERN